MVCLVYFHIPLFSQSIPSFLLLSLLCIFPYFRDITEDILLPISNEFHAPLNTYAHATHTQNGNMTCSFERSPNDGRCLCACVQNASNSGRNRCDQHALPVLLFTC